MKITDARGGFKRVAYVHVFMIHQRLKRERGMKKRKEKAERQFQYVLVLAPLRGGNL